LNKTVNLLGSTGSIGTQTLEVCRKYGISVNSLAARSSCDMLIGQAREFNPTAVCIYDEDCYTKLKNELFGSGIKVLCGMEGLCTLAADSNADITVNAVVGMVGLRPTLAAIESGMDIALANKETLVCGGKLVMESAAKKGVKILPIDSEHSAIFQSIMALRGERGNQLKGIILTASGGPFYGKKAEELENVTIEQALAHPNWSMGKKITVDSATMMNKGLELIEAMWLFDLPPESIEIVIHRQSILHSAVVFSDNAVIGQMGVPDMKIPIQFALTYPERYESLSKPLKLTEIGTLTFEKPDFDTFVCLKTAVEAAKIGGTAPAVVNGANEAATALFIDGKIGFTRIGELVRGAFDEIKSTDITDISDCLRADRKAREYVNSMSKAELCSR